MFGIDSGELLIICVVALVVIGPKDLPRAMRAIGNFVGRARGMARHFRSGIDTMIREAEFEELEKKWKADNERIMRDHPAGPAPAPAVPDSDPGAEDGDSDWGKAAPEQLAGKVPPAPRAVRGGSAPPIPPAGVVPPPSGERP